jgi:hypothetical protein
MTDLEKALEDLGAAQAKLMERFDNLRKWNETLQVAAALLVKHAGTPAFCKGCGAGVYYIGHRDTGKVGIYNPDSTSHFGTCPKADQFKRKKEAQHAG